MVANYNSQLLMNKVILFIIILFCYILYNIFWYYSFIKLYLSIRFNKIKIFRQNCLTYQTIASLNSTVRVRWLCVFKIARRTARRIACDCRVKRIRKWSLSISVTITFTKNLNRTLAFLLDFHFYQIHLESE